MTTGRINTNAVANRHILKAADADGLVSAFRTAFDNEDDTSFARRCAEPVENNSVSTAYKSDRRAAPGYQEHKEPSFPLAGVSDDLRVEEQKPFANVEYQERALHVGPSEDGRVDRALPVLLLTHLRGITGSFVPTHV
ncbi:hypothetical protein CYMTET_56786 [Cymbomonas tetramitiformis]|uniref:Uncharacterized protein n=1 Tax=Cymbomonas tetramitiformis TaxID=36881 RepID=A0AAE0ELL8_9CHLO|nr:hypothetical protein CYMTET_56786 [Cymbomonas tetramitiformis]